MIEKSEFDDRPEPAKRLEQARVSRGFDKPIDACRFFGWVYESYMHHEAGTRGLSRVSGKYAVAFRVSEGWLLTGEGDAPAAPRIPVMGAAAGSVTGFNIIHAEPIDFVASPPALTNSRDAYAIFVRGSSMEPQYWENDLIFVNPHKTPVPGDAIVIQQQIRGEIVAFIKTLRSNDKKVLKTSQHNPQAIVEFPLETVVSVHRVMTINELFGI